MTSSSSDNYPDDDDGKIIVDYDELVRRIRAEFNRERNKTEELSTFVARVIALLTVARDDYYEGLDRDEK